MQKVTVDELTRLAFVFAESDRENYALCCAMGSAERDEAMLLAKKFRNYRMKRWGGTAFEKAISDVTHVVDVRTGKVTLNSK